VVYNADRAAVAIALRLKGERCRPVSRRNTAAATDTLGK
jgi:hypothetical protein